MTKPTTVRPTQETYHSLQMLFGVYNRALFGAILPNCMITYTAARRGMMGYFRPNAMANVAPDHIDDVTVTHQIMLSSVALAEHGASETHGTLVHEMCHMWQHVHGKPTRGGYHNREWADKMIEVGLTPSDTGREGGKQTGQQMDHYVTSGGRFETLSTELIDSGKYPIRWADLLGMLAKTPSLAPTLVGKAAGDGGLITLPYAGPGPRSGKRVKYVCPICGNAAWGRGEMNISCAGGAGKPDHDPMAML